MKEEIKFIDKEIQRLEDIQRKTQWRLFHFRKVRKGLEKPQRAKILGIKQLDLFDSQASIA